MKYHTIMVELTTNCNMRCAYCELSHPHWQRRDMDDTCIRKIIDFVKVNEIAYVCLHGHGEMSIIPNWHNIANEILQTGTRLTTCTNLTKKFSPEEIATLAKFDSITVSLDTMDVDLFRTLRRGGDIRNILYNMAVIQTAAREQNHEIYWIWNVVVCNKNVHKLMDICEVAATYNVKNITLCNLVKLNPLIPVSADILHVREMQPIDIHNAIEEINKCRSYCSANEIDFVCDSLLGALNA